MSAPAPCPKCDRDLVPSAVQDEHWCPGGCGYLRDGAFTEYSPAKTNGTPTVEVSVRTETPDPPPIGEVLDELAAFVRRFVVMSEAQADAVALWIAHTHAFDAAEQTPYLAISSAEKRSGKTRLLEVLELLVARPWLTGRVTAAVLARKSTPSGLRCCSTSRTPRSRVRRNTPRRSAVC
jgi:hypothetical protein